MEKKSRKFNNTKSLVTKEKKVIHKCCECGRLLTEYEVSDNLYAGMNIKDYVCYGCQPEISDDDEDYSDPEYDNLTW